MDIQLSMRNFLRNFSALGASILLLASCSSIPAIPEPAGTDLPWLAIVEQARFAQNAHNVQSWRLRLEPDGSVTGGLNPARLLPETDPISRQLVLSLGNFTEAARRAAASIGYRLDAEWIAPELWSASHSPGADLFRWTLQEQPPVSNQILDGLTAATAKYLLDPVTLPDVQARDLEQQYTEAGLRVFVEQETQRVRESAELAIAAFAVEMRHEPTRMESYHLTRLGRRARRDHPWGLSLGASFGRFAFRFIDPVTAAFPQDPEEFADSGIDLFNRTVAPTSSLVVITTDANDPETWFSAGQTLQSVWMEVRSAGLELLPLSQGLQEYREVAELYERFHELWAPDGHTVQMLMMLGRPRGRATPSPRIPATELLGLHDN